MSRYRYFIPNCLTALRMALVPVFVFCYFYVDPLAGLFIYGFACLTDVLDGFFARRWQVVSRFGQWADPVADKIMIITVSTSLSFTWQWLWIATGILFIKELLMIIGGIIVYFRKDMHLIFPAKPIGKLATVVIFIGLVSSFFGEYINPWHYILMTAGLICSVIAFFYYLINNHRKTKMLIAERQQNDLHE